MTFFLDKLFLPVRHEKLRRTSLRWQTLPLSCGVRRVFFALVLSASSFQSLEAGQDELSEELLAKGPPGLYTQLINDSSLDLIVLLNDKEAEQAVETVRKASGSALNRVAALEKRKNAYFRSKQRLRHALSNSSIQFKRDYSALPMSILTVKSVEDAAWLLSQEDVVRVYENSEYKLSLSQSAALIGATVTTTAGYLGDGAAVAVLDTGVDFTRDAFGQCSSPADRPACRVKFAADFTDEDDGARDAHGHGTNVSGIVLGIAPRADILSLDVFNGTSARASDIIAAIDWAIVNANRFNIVAMNLSLGSYPHSSECDTSWATMPFHFAREAGIIPVVAAGNDGRKDGISAPACAPGAVRVGATYDHNYGQLGWRTCVDEDASEDTVTCFSNSADFLTLLAPGAMIDAAGLRMSGTSMAAPHVAGAIAVLRAPSAFSQSSIDSIVDLLHSTGSPTTDAGNGLTHPRIDLANALSVPIPAQVPKLISFSPPIASESETVTINGTGFSGVTKVSFGGAPAENFDVISAAKIAAVLGSGASGRILVQNAEGSASIDGFVYRDAVPMQLFVSPSSANLSLYREQLQLRVWITYSDGTTSNVGSNVTYSSMDHDVVTVSEDGVITAVGSGFTEIDITSGGLSRRMPVSVEIEGITDREVEPNGRIELANPIAANAAQFSGRLSNAEDVDLYRFVLEEAGQFSVSVIAENDVYDGGSIQVSIEDSYGTALASRVVRSDTGAETHVIANMESGVGIIRIAKRDGYTIFDKDYVVTTNVDRSDGWRSTLEVESNDTQCKATSVNSRNSVIAGQLSGRDDVDYFGVDVLSSGALTIIAQPADTQYDGGSVQVSLFDESGRIRAARVIRSDDRSPVLLSAVVARPGRFVAKVEAREGYQIFDKSYLIQVDLSENPDFINGREIEPNNSLDEAHVLDLDEGRIKGQLHAREDIDVFLIGADPGPFSIQVSPSDTRYDGGSVEAAILDEGGSVLASDIVRSDSQEPVSLQVTATVRSQYFVRIGKRNSYRIFDKDYIVEYLGPRPQTSHPRIRTLAPELDPDRPTYTYSVAASDDDLDELVFSFLHAPPGATIGRTSGIISWEWGEFRRGRYYFSIAVRDSFGGFATQAFELFVPVSRIIRPDDCE